MRPFGKAITMNDLNLTVQAGEVFGLLRPNRAGKSTAIKMLTTGTDCLILLAVVVVLTFICGKLYPSIAT